MKKIVIKILLVSGLVFCITGTANATLVLHYGFDEATGTLAAESAGVGNPAYDGTLRSGLNFDNASVTGKYSGALNMNGDVDIAMNTTDGTKLPGQDGAGNNFTISLWFKNANWTDGGVIFSYGKNALLFSIGFGSLNGVPEIRVYSKDQNGSGSADDVLIREQLPLPGIDNNVWHHLAVAVSSTLNNTAADPLIYVDGSSTGGTATTSAWVTEAGVRMGCRVTTVNSVVTKSVFYDGYVDDFAIFDTTLSTQEISAIYNSATAIPEPATLILFGIGSLVLIKRRK